MKNNISKYIAYGLIYLSLFSSSYAAETAPLTHQLTALTIAIKAPELRLQNMDEYIIDIKNLTSKVLVINFWATWCPPCRREMSSLERLYQATKDKNVEVLAVNIGEDIDNVFAFMGELESMPNFQILFNPEGDMMETWRVQGLPTTYIIDKKGMIVYKAIGGRQFDHPDILKIINSLILK